MPHSVAGTPKPAGLTGFRDDPPHTFVWRAYGGAR